MCDKNLHNRHRERMRDRFINTGFNGFQPHEILELLLFYSIPRRNTNETAHVLLNNFGGLYEILEADKDELLEMEGLGEKSAILIKVCRDICKYFLSNERYQKNIKEPIKYLKNYFSNLSAEIFVIISLNSSMQIKAIHTIPINIFKNDKSIRKNLSKTILRSKAKIIIVGRNHINRSYTPDINDYWALKVIKESIIPLEVILYDYIIYTESKIFSFINEGVSF